MTKVYIVMNEYYFEGNGDPYQSEILQVFKTKKDAQSYIRMKYKEEVEQTFSDLHDYKIERTPDKVDISADANGNIWESTYYIDERVVM